MLAYMQAPLFVRSLMADEHAALEAGLHSASGFTVRRCHMLLASAAGQHTPAIATTLRCNDQTVRNAIHAFNTGGLPALTAGSSRPRTDATIFDAPRRDQLRALLHHSPRTFGKPTSVWTLALAAEVCVAEGITPQLVSDETIRTAIHTFGLSWKRAKHWMTSPDPEYARKKSDVTA